MKLRPFQIKTTVMVLIFSMLFCGILFWLKWLLDAELKNITYTTLNTVVLQETYNFNMKIKNELQQVQTLASVVSNLDTADVQGVLNILKAVVKETSFTKLTIADTQGNAIDTNEKYTNIADYGFFSDVLAGETILCQPYEEGWDERASLEIAAPIYKNDKVIGVLSASYSVKQLNLYFKESFFYGEGALYIINQSGDIILKDENPLEPIYSDNLFDIFSQNTPEDLSDLEKIYENMNKNLGGSGTYMVNGSTQYVKYHPLNINGWYLVSTILDQIVSKQATHISKYTFAFTGFFIVIFLLLAFYIVFSQKKHIKELAKIAFIDSLTGAYNRNQFNILVEELLTKTADHYAFFLFDIDKFKVLNDTLSYESGDALLKGISNILKSNISKNEFAARSDSDEFFALLEYTDDIGVQVRAEKIIQQIIDYFHTEIDQRYNLVLCVGVYIINDPKEPINNIADKARHAHRLIKGNQLSSISFYDEKIRNFILAEKNIENKMHDALKNNEFLIYLQPKYALNNEKIYGAEALVRWDNKESCMIYPNDFIPLFEKNGFIIQLDMYMLEKACQCIRFWISQGTTPIPISVNFSKLHLQNEHFVEEIAKIVKEYGISPGLIEIELTESTMLNNESILIEVLCKLHQHGFMLSMDDFGSGYSSLGMLKNLPVDTLKLDRTFFTQYTDLTRAKTVIESVILMAKKLGISTVAEGVETKEHINLLRELGCDIVQGFYYAKPMSLLDISQMLNDQDLVDQDIK